MDTPRISPLAAIPQLRQDSAVQLEGGLFGPDLLERLATGDLPGQKPADFGLSSGRTLVDEIAEAYCAARDLWQHFRSRLQQLPQGEAATSLTRETWVIPLLGLLGYRLLYNHKAYEIDGLTYAISHRAGEHPDAPPVHIAGARCELGRVDPTGRPRLSPHALMQEFLNHTDHLWGLVTNGLILRLLRDSTYVRRQAYVEFDLEAIFEAEGDARFDDFVVLYRLIHRSRLPQGTADAHQCWLERYHQQAIEQGNRARDRLRDGVEECLKILGTGFLQANPDWHLDPRAFYEQLLRLVYRFLFLLVAEERELLGGSDLYREHYSISRLRRLVDRREAYTEHDDLWQSLRVLFYLLRDPSPQANGYPLASLLELAVLDGELFEPIDLEQRTLTNCDLLQAFFHLTYYWDDQAHTYRRVNYAALDVEELGSVYESLLDHHALIQGRSLALAPGTERKSTGSYYTPPELVAELIRSALEPVIEERLEQAGSNNSFAEQALLSIRVLDPACGSGHFLLAAARRLGLELARLRTGEEEPSPEARRQATREVIAHCIYGVDKNPLAVELCKVALWIESQVPSKPLTFLDHRIRCGDSLVGVFDLSVLEAGIPDEAFESVSGDDKTAATQLKKRNRSERRDLESGQLLIPFDFDSAVAELASEYAALETIPDDTPAHVKEKQRRFESARHSPFATRQLQACNLWTAAFFQSLVSSKQQVVDDTTAERLAARQSPLAFITTDTLRRYLESGTAHPQALAIAEALAVHNCFFHWPLEFPEVLHPSPIGRGAGGEGNPPQPKRPLPDDLLHFARQLRRNLTDAEKLLWTLLRGRQFGGWKFRRQHPMPPYVLDFYCHELRLAIELDGGQHNTPEQLHYDQQRSEYLAAKGIKVLRFWNNQVLQETEAVLQAIWNEAIWRQQQLGQQSESLTLTLSPRERESSSSLPLGEGLGERVSSPLPPGEGPGERVSSPLPPGEGPGVRESSFLTPQHCGFDVVIGNPPWERIKLQEQEFFASRDSEIANAPNAAARKKRIAELQQKNPQLWQEYQQALHAAESTSRFLRGSGFYPLTGRGDINTYSVFAERMRALLRPGGRAGIILPTGIATDDTNKHFFADLVERGELASLYDFENRKGIFLEVHRSYKFCLLTLRRVVAQRAAPLCQPAEFVFFCHKAADLADPERRFTLTPEDFRLLNPNTRTTPIFRSRRDAELTKHIYRRVPVLVREALTPGPTPTGKGVPEGRGEDINPWGVEFLRMFDMANDSHLFRTREELEAEGFRLEGNVFIRPVGGHGRVPLPGHTRGSSVVAPHAATFLPLYEAKMIHQFDHRFATYRGERRASGEWQVETADVGDTEKADPTYQVLPRYWVPEEEVEARLRAKGWDRGWLLGWRDITNATNERTVIAAVIPRVGVGNKIPLIVARCPSPHHTLLGALLCALPLDYAARQKVGGTTLNFFIFGQLPVLPPSVFDQPLPFAWESDHSPLATGHSPTIADFIRPRVLELTYTAWDLKPFAEDLGYDGPPFRYDPERRFQLRCELDALFFLLYLGTPEEWEREATPELKALFPTPREAVAYILEQFPIVKRKDEERYGVYQTKETILRRYDDWNDANT
jgi:very-short-patch-repair endonuclease